MEVSSFSDFRKEIEKSDLKKSIIDLGNYTFKIVTPFDFSDLIDLVMLLLFSSVFLLYSSLLVISILSFSLFWHRLYINFRGIGILKIDFMAKKITIKNRVFIINILRKIFEINPENKFNSIKEIRYEESSLMDKLGFIQLKKTYLLLIETFKDTPVAVSRFESEEDVKTLTSILKKFLLTEEKIIA
jgi:hypothetical protein